MGDELSNGVKYNRAWHKFAEIVVNRNALPWYYSPITFALSSLAKEWRASIDLLNHFAVNAISARKNFIKTNQQESAKESFTPLIDMLLKYNTSGQLSDEHLRSEVSTIYLTGHETASTAIAWTLFALGNHLDIQERIREEIDQVWNGQKPLSEEDLKNLPLLDCCVKESLRMYAPVPFIVRKVEEEIRVNGHVIPKGVRAIIGLEQLHYDEQYYPDSHQFRPERFLDQKSGGSKCQFIPFSYGLRSCIASKFAQQEMKVVIASILRGHRVISKDTFDKIIVTDNVLRASDNPLMVKFEAR